MSLSSAQARRGDAGTALPRLSLTAPSRNNRGLGDRKSQSPSSSSSSSSSSRSRWCPASSNRPTTSPTRKSATSSATSKIHHNARWRRKVNPSAKLHQQQVVVLAQHDGSWERVVDEEGEEQQPSPDTWDEAILRQRFPSLQAYEAELVSLLYIEALWRHRCITVEASRRARRATLRELHGRLREQFVLCRPGTPVAAARMFGRVHADARVLCDTLVLSHKEVKELEAVCADCSGRLMEKFGQFQWLLESAARSIQGWTRVFLAQRRVRRARKARKQHARLQERLERRVAAAAERATMARARETARQACLLPAEAKVTVQEAKAAVADMERASQLEQKREAAVRRREEQQQRALAAKGRRLAELGAGHRERRQQARRRQQQQQPPPPPPQQQLQEGAGQGQRPRSPREGKTVDDAGDQEPRARSGGSDGDGGGWDGQGAGISGAGGDDDGSIEEKEGMGGGGDSGADGGGDKHEPTFVRKKKLARQRAADREQRRRGLRDRAAKRDAARRRTLTEMLERRKAAQERARQLEAQRDANEAARSEIRAKVALVRANRIMERDPVFRGILRAYLRRRQEGKKSSDKDSEGAGSGSGKEEETSSSSAEGGWGDGT